MRPNLILILRCWPLLLLAACQPARPPKSPAFFTVTGFDPAVNYQPGKDTKKISLDYTNALDSGFIMPTARQVKGGYFETGFNIVNNGDSAADFYYKIYYQNETYKYPESLDGRTANPLASENFYGSWEDVSVGFLSAGTIPNDGQAHPVRSRFRIVGNPRDEQKYYGTARTERNFSEAEIQSIVDHIKANAKWLGDISVKARENGVSVDEQLARDAQFVLEERRKNFIFNNRWKRNPRVGTYAFLLVVTTREGLARIPKAVRNISISTDDGFVNPFAYFLYTDGVDLPQTVCKVSDITLKVSGKPPLGNGIFINTSQMASNGVDYRGDCMNDHCNDRPDMYHNAMFAQFFHHIKGAMRFKNIPKVMDLQSGDYTRRDYDRFLDEYQEGQMVDAAIANSDCPCNDVASDSLTRSLLVKNQPSPEGKWEKLNAGLVSRHGFTYGKFTAKVKFPQLLNVHNMWNGLTNAFWMINESNDEWNSLRACEPGGYIPKHLQGKDAPRAKTTSYSEIDIEIRKASPNWPATSYNIPDIRPGEDPGDSNKIVVTCTNWDLACPAPKKYNAGTQHIKFRGRDYLFHRWDHWYQALTVKHAYPDDELFAGDYYYFQIDWRPDTIIWRMGPEKDALEEIGFLDNTISTIPNNQMLMVFTQEYHPSIWWPESPQLLEYIPFTKNEIVGRVLDISIE
jgi:hypothetical protein